MPHISSKKLKHNTYQRIENKLLATFEDACRNHDSRALFTELFTHTEKTMLAKRLAMIVLLSKEIPQHRIVDILEVSPSTVAKMSLNLEKGRYNTLLKLTSRKKTEFLELIEFLLSGGGLMPPIAGRGRWKRIFKEF